MNRVQSRLRNLEAVMTDDRGLIPHTPQWLDYWTSQLGKAFAGAEIAERIPLAAARAILAEFGGGEATRATMTR